MGRKPFSLTLFLIVTDAILINFSFILAYIFRFHALDLSTLISVAGRYLNLLIFITFVWLAIFSLFNLYERKRAASEIDEVAGVLGGTTVALLLLLAITLIQRELFFSRRVIIYGWLMATLFIGASRIILLETQKIFRKKGIGVERTIMIGAGELGQTLTQKIISHPELGYRVVGFLDDDPQKLNQNFHKIKVLDSTDKVAEVVERYKVNNVIIATAKIPTTKVLNIVSQCEVRRVEVKMVPDILEIMASRISTDEVGGIPLITVREIQLYGFNAFLKRSVDLILTSLLLIILSPLWLFIALLIKIDSPGAVFFKQERVGQDGKPFMMYKFRSMVAGAEELLEQVAPLSQAEGLIFKIKDDPRITRVGKFLRRMSLDEFPQLINVLKGEMSLVGPRPPLPREVEKYEDWHKKRLRITPGVTGLWQVSGRSELPFEDMARLDIYYIENWSLWLDFKILLRTIPIVLLGSGAY